MARAVLAEERAGETRPAPEIQARRGAEHSAPCTRGCDECKQGPFELCRSLVLQRAEQQGLEVRRVPIKEGGDVLTVMSVEQRLRSRRRPLVVRVQCAPGQELATEPCRLDEIHGTACRRRRAHAAALRREEWVWSVGQRSRPAWRGVAHVCQITR